MQCVRFLGKRYMSNNSELNTLFVYFDSIKFAIIIIEVTSLVSSVTGEDIL